jgi:mono/diheme cytochrome c family protein
MPGDFSSLDPSGNPKVMESFGAGSVEISAGNTRYNLKPGATARVTIPVDRGQLVAGSPLPPTIPLLYYDERRGLWVEEGELKLVGTGIARAYEAEIKHLSSLNADLQKSGQSCVAVRSGPGLPATYTVEVTLPPFSAGAAPIVRSFPIDNSTGSEHVIYNLPNNKNIVLVPIVAGIKPDGSPGDVPAGVFVVNTGGPQTSAANPPPGPPYYNTDASGNPIGPCLTRVDLANLAIPSAPDAPYEFLQGLDVQSTNLTELTASDPALAAAIEAASTAYYTLIDQRGLRQDLIDFKDRNRFGQPLNTVNGELEVSAAYANSGDLGFGRSMHCRRSRASDGAFDIACYVTNYGDHTTPDADDAAAAAIQDATREVATVAMEYTRVENPLGDPIEFPDNSRTVKFYVYKKALASPTHAGQGNGRATSANLDGAGERPVPQLCVVCHGGVYASEPADPSNPGGLQKPAFAFRNDIFMQSRFIPFDLHFFTSPPAPNTVAAQQSAFRTLNLEIVRHVPEGALASDPVVELIDELYPGLAATQDDNAVVPNWDKATPASVDRKFYLDVFSRACRSCHITSPFGNVVMNNKNDFRALIANVQSRVCDQHVMPHAKRTHDLFWTSLGPNMAAQLQVYGQAIPGWDPTTPNAQCGLSYTPGGNVSVSTFTTEIQPIFTSRCTACHGTQAPFNANLALSAGNAYPNLFSGGVPVVSVEHPPTPRVRPGNSGDSYLYRKIEGTHPSLPPPFVAPGPGSQMPQGGPDLATVDNDGDGTNDREEIRVWIDVLGAPGP